MYVLGRFSKAISKVNIKMDDPSIRFQSACSASIRGSYTAINARTGRGLVCYTILPCALSCAYRTCPDVMLYTKK